MSSTLFKAVFAGAVTAGALLLPLNAAQAAVKHHPCDEPGVSGNAFFGDGVGFDDDLIGLADEFIGFDDDVVDVDRYHHRRHHHNTTVVVVKHHHKHHPKPAATSDGYAKPAVKPAATSNGYDKPVANGNATKPAGSDGYHKSTKNA
jgi:hypothetical protein